MPSLLDELCPDYVGEATLALSLDSERPRAFSPVDVVVDYAQTLPHGVVLPLELTVSAPSAAHFVRKIFSRTVPHRITFVPREGGSHLVRLAEVGHNRWFGALRIDIAGEVAIRR